MQKYWQNLIWRFKWRPSNRQIHFYTNLSGYSIFWASQLAHSSILLTVVWVVYTTARLYWQSWTLERCWYSWATPASVERALSTQHTRQYSSDKSRPRNLLVDGVSLWCASIRNRCVDPGGVQGWLIVEVRCRQRRSSWLCVPPPRPWCVMRQELYNLSG